MPQLLPSPPFLAMLGITFHSCLVLLLVLQVSVVLCSASVVNVCGGDGFDLSNLTSSDIRVGDMFGMIVWYLRPCGPVSEPSCQSLSSEPNSTTPSLCQVDSFGSRGLIDYSPVNATWSAYSVTQRSGILPEHSAGVLLHMQDNGPCPGQRGTRWMDIYWQCDTNIAAGEGKIWSWAAGNCGYTLIAHTAASCVRNVTGLASSSSSLVSPLVLIHVVHSSHSRLVLHP